ncbi:MAG: polymer-forming cytoskeletal protein [Kiritimatiellae bacterium]|nr:polymer-forming cytoskeletal protein [Kiritimatiellia bacterium]MCO5061426.1 polymer-forming cytoskeletal protein [Kiritimatiellia bacterium]MCO6400325.1 polymer-forming cytoskeletal protein [Verrucomicrobiota bacterium]
MANENGQTIISADVQITGTIKSNGPIRIDGKLEGDLICAADAVIGRNAVIKGGLQVNSVVVEGMIQGNISAKDKIDMKSTAKVHGDIAAKRLAVEDGVTFIGRSEVNPTGAVAGAPAQAPAASQEPPAADNKGGGMFGRR